MSVASSIASTVARPVCRSVLSLNIGSIAVSYIDSALRNDVVAYSFRRLFADYSGSAFRVRRSSDNAEQDIGFGSDGNLDYATLLSFCGAGSGYVKTWYDQGAASLDATQSTTTRQPRTVDSGSVQLNGAYTGGIKFDGSDDYLMTSSNFDCSGTDEASILIGLGSIASLSADTAIAYSSGHVNNRGIGVLSGGTGTTLRIAQFSGGGAYEIKDRSAEESGRRLVGFKCNNSDSSGSRVIPFWNNAYSSTGCTTTRNTRRIGRCHFAVATQQAAPVGQFETRTTANAAGESLAPQVIRHIAQRAPGVVTEGTGGNAEREQHQQECGTWRHEAGKSFWAIISLLHPFDARRESASHPTPALPLRKAARPVCRRHAQSAA